MISTGLADRLREIEGSPTLALTAKAKALAKSGKAVINFAGGEPDFPTPEHIKQAGIKAIEANQTSYTPIAGIPELRAAVADNLNHKRKTGYDASQVMISCGAKHALYNIFQVLTQPGDEVIILSPYWVSFPSIVRLSGATPVFVESKQSDGFQPDLEAIRSSITNSTKAIIINSPSNPTGTVITRDRLEAIAHLAIENNIAVISDEIYDRLVFSPAEHISIIEVEPELVDQLLLVGGASKTYSMTGWRIGYVAGPKQWIDAMTKLQGHSTSNPTSISQYAALEAIKGDQGPANDMLIAFQKRRDQMVKGLNSLPGCHCEIPQGAFYAWCNVSGLGGAADLSMRWLEEVHVAAVPGEGFGAPGYVRFSFATSMDAINQGIDRLKNWCNKNAG